MNPFASVAGLAVRPADLADASECRRIEAFVRGASQAEVFHLPQWSRAVERGCGQRGHYLLAEDAGGGIVGVLPLIEVRSPLFGNALVSVGFGTSGGIVADDDAIVDRLAAVSWNIAERLGCGTVELRGGPIPEGWQVQEGVYAGFSKPLPQDDAAILRSIKRRHRSIRRSEEFNLSVRCGGSEADLRDHFTVYSESVRNLGSPVFPPRLFEAMLDEFREEADILTVSMAGRPMASVLNFYFNGTVHAYWGGGVRDARDCFANEVMYYELMRHSVRRGCDRFDFGRSKVGSGPYSFKSNWGFDPQPIRHAIRTSDGAPPRDINPMSPKYRLQVAAWQRMPLWLANRIGPAIARGLG